MNNIFISHYHADDDKVQSIKSRLIEKGYDVRNFSVDSTKHKDGRKPSKEVIERYLRIRVKASSTFICIIGPETHTRSWVDFEIKEAIKQGKKIIGIYTHGNKDAVDIPEPLKKYGASVIGWNSIDKLGDIIEGNERVFDNFDGSSSGGYYSTGRVPC